MTAVAQVACLITPINHTVVFMAGFAAAAEDPESFETLQASYKLFEGSVIQVIIASQSQQRVGSRKLLASAAHPDVHRLASTPIGTSVRADIVQSEHKAQRIMLAPIPSSQ